MKNLTLIIITSILVFGISCNQNHSSRLDVSKEEIYAEIEKGNFTIAESLINSFLMMKSISQSDVYEMNYQKDLMFRIRRDFAQTEEELTSYLKEYYPDLTIDQLREWEKKKYIEVKIIDGERKYFNRAGRNFFRINPDENKVRIAIDGEEKIDETAFSKKVYVPKVIQSVKETGKETVDEQSFLLKYKLTVDANVVPENEIIRCWLPYPRINTERLPSIEFISCNLNEYIIADKEQMQRTIYMEKPSIKDEATEFEVSFKITTAAQWFNINPEDIKPYDTEKEIYKPNTAERLPHIIFTDQIKNLTDSIVGDEKNPYNIVRKIYTWIDDNIPWASALEYGIMQNIPNYVLENRHGDCGMQTLLFMTMARYKGIPAKWQSGWMLHPKKVNLHDWAEVYYEGIGWVPVDQSFSLIDSEDNEVRYFYSTGIDAYRLIVNDDYGRNLYPAKIYPRSEPYDFQRGEVEWKGGNLYFDKWDYHLDVEYLDEN
jgi:transglutaminase superfamily protein